MAGGELLRVEDLRVYFRTMEGVVKAVEGATFSIKEGEVFGLVGESGCGKSTIGLTILRLLPPNAIIEGGSVVYRGRNLLELPERELEAIRGREISMVFQDPSTTLNPLFTVGEQLADVLRTHLGVEDRGKLEELALRALKMVRMPDPARVLHMYPHELSGGMQQRAVIAIALSTRPRLLIADEPTTALDVTIQAQILELLTDLKEELGLSLLFITHNLGVMAEVGDRLAVMYAGTVVEEGTVECVFESPLHPYTVGLLESVPRVSKRKRPLKYIPGSVPSLLNPPPGCRFHPRCPRAMEVCRRERPVPIEVERGHRVACHLYSRR